MADTLPDKPLLFLARRPGEELATWVDDAALAPVSDADASAALRVAVNAFDHLARVATRRAGDMHKDPTQRGAALSAVERASGDALAALRTVALASGLERPAAKEGA